MNFETQILEEKNILYIKLPKRLDTTNSIELKNIVKKNIEEGKVNIILDTSDTDFVDSSGLSAIVFKLADSRAKNGDIYLVNVKDYVKEILKITNIDKIIKIFDSKKSAIENFKG